MEAFFFFDDFYSLRMGSVHPLGSYMYGSSTKEQFTSNMQSPFSETDLIQDILDGPPEKSYNFLGYLFHALHDQLRARAVLRSTRHVTSLEQLWIFL